MIPSTSVSCSSAVDWVTFGTAHDGNEPPILCLEHSWHLGVASVVMSCILSPGMNKLFGLREIVECRIRSCAWLTVVSVDELLPPSDTVLVL
jgi:hypothetical protein